MPNTDPQLTTHATRGLVARNWSVSPLTAHFVATVARRLGISQAEFLRRCVDNALVQWAGSGLYSVPVEFKDCPLPLPKPTPHRLAALKHAS